MKRRCLAMAAAVLAATAVAAEPATVPSPPPAPIRARPVRAGNPLQRIPRVTLEVVLGTASAAGMAFGGYQLGCAISGSDYTTAANCGNPGIYGAGAGLALGIPLGVMLGGALLDGDGGLAPTLFGAGFGVAAMVGGLLFLQRSAPDLNPAPLVVLPLAFAVVGYELSSHDSRAAAQAEAKGKRASLLIVPGAIRGGAAVSVLVLLP
ncbi:MAG TPA: hypothetical protein VND93_00290 [Myxococcales bacterium]|nr:hypothetical protein [Myxococcales bacterium]